MPASHDRTPTVSPLTASTRPPAGATPGSDEDRDAPCGWFDSSLELASGLDVTEIDGDPEVE